MLFKALFSTSLLVSLGLAHSVEKRGVQRCGAPKPSKGQISVAEHFAETEAAARASGLVSIAAATINVNVYVHVVSTSTSAADGYLDVRSSVLL